MNKHPAIALYEELFFSATTGQCDRIPFAQEPVGRAWLDSEMDKRGIPYPENMCDYWNWWIEIGGERTAKRLARKWKRTKDNAMGVQER